MRKILFIVAFIVSFTANSWASKKIVVNLSTQTATAYQNGKRLFSGRVSSGKSGHRTPRGSFRVLEKDKWHRSTIYPKPNGGARMSYMLRLTNGGIALHLGRVPSYPASHGCIRMTNGFAQKMYRWARVGTRVYVKGNPSGGSVHRSHHKSRKKRRHRTKRKIHRTKRKIHRLKRKVHRKKRRLKRIRVKKRHYKRTALEALRSR